MAFVISFFVKLFINNDGSLQELIQRGWMGWLAINHAWPCSYLGKTIGGIVCTM